GTEAESEIGDGRSRGGRNEKKPALILQCDPGDLFVVRNVANIVPPYEKDGSHHGTSAALEFGICFLKVEHLIILGHSQCGGIIS
ncbi:carbonic anhydrase, partial [Klebsiella pneumoniae]|uniref:carbonic anhydrase n=1 Tax=Klebsiella pneumoniae TaxID=573 RepID=UPI004055501B